MTAPRIHVMGAGAFGTALAIALARGGRIVTLWARDPARIESLSSGTDPLLDTDLPPGLTPTTDPDPGAADATLIAVPMQRLTDLITAHGSLLGNRTLVACCKGIDLTTATGPTALLDGVPGATAAILTGPSFAADIARGLPTALTLAGGDRNLQRALSTPSLRLYRTDDRIGAEIGGALKNVTAIACGAAMGAGLGASARAALMTRGHAETVRLAAALGARPETLAGLSGLGDLALTCTSEQSRNYRLGLALGRGDPPDETQTVEGAATARAVLPLAARHDIPMPIAETVAALTTGAMTVPEAMDALLARPLRSET